MLVRFYTPAGVMNSPSNMGYMVYVRAICLSSWLLLWGGEGGGKITLFPVVHNFTLCKFQKMPKEQLILHWSPWGAINCLRQAGLHTSYLPSVELGASLRGGGEGKLPFCLWCTISLFVSFRKCLKNNSYYTGPHGVQLIVSDKLDYIRAICRLLSWVLLWGGRGGGDIDLVPTKH